MTRKIPAYSHSSPSCPRYPNAAGASYFKKKRMLILGRMLIGVLVMISFVCLTRLA